MENNRSRIQAWLEAARPKTLPASFSPVLVGCALAYRDGVFKLAPAILCVLVALLAQIASNFANDYFDFKKGADKEDRLGPERAVASGWITPKANVGVAMNSGTQAAKEAGNMVDLDNDPTKLIEIVEIGKQLLMTRGTLTTFSIANDVAKYFAIVPALFMVAIPELAALNIMNLHSPESAILSAVIFNAIIIPILIPLALRGVQYKPIGASALLRRNLLIYGVVRYLKH